MQFVGNIRLILGIRTDEKMIRRQKGWASLKPSDEKRKTSAISPRHLGGEDREEVEVIHVKTQPPPR